MTGGEKEMKMMKYTGMLVLSLLALVIPAMAVTDTELSNSTAVTYVTQTLIPLAFTVLLTPPLNIFVAVVISFITVLFLAKVIRRLG